MCFQYETSAETNGVSIARECFLCDFHPPGICHCKHIRSRAIYPPRLDTRQVQLAKLLMDSLLMSSKLTPEDCCLTKPGKPGIVVAA